MRINIEDLEALKELSDELEENHTETEKHLHQEIGSSWLNSTRLHIFIAYIETKETMIRENLRKIGSLEENCLDYENTIQQFRELVMQLQTYVLSSMFVRSELTLDSRSATSINCACKPRLLRQNLLRLHLRLRTSCPSTLNYNRRRRRIKHARLIWKWKA